MLPRLTFLLLFFLVIGCQPDAQQQKLKSYFDIEGNLVENQGYEKVYLSYIVKNQIILIDSANIKDDKFHFRGPSTFPKKTHLQFYQYGTYFPFILSGEKIKIELNAYDLSQSKVENSRINQEWQSLKTKSHQIYGDIDYLFPTLQKARLQNDFKTLLSIQQKIDSIEIINRAYLLRYVSDNPNSQLAALILNDLYYQAGQDSILIVETAKKIPAEFQKALDFDINP